jgi:HK97 family phage major capsid protein
MKTQNTSTYLLHSFIEQDSVIAKETKSGNLDPLSIKKMENIQNALDESNSVTKKRPQIESNSGASKKYIASPEYQAQLNQYMRTGTNMTNLDGSIMDPAISSIVFTQQMTDSINNYLANNSIIRKLSNIITTSDDSFDLVASKSGVQAVWGDEYAVSTPSEALVKKIIKLHDITTQPQITRRAVQDSEVDVMIYVTNLLCDIFLSAENNAFINGNGIDKPMGIVTAVNSGAISSVTSANSSIDLDSVMNLYYSLNEKYTNDAAFIANRSTIHAIRRLKDSNGQYLWMPGLLSGKADTLMGTPIFTTSEMQDATKGSVAMIYGNFGRGYQIIDRSTISLLRDPYSNKPFITFSCVKSVGADVVNADCFKALKIA